MLIRPIVLDLSSCLTVLPFPVLLLCSLYLTIMIMHSFALLSVAVFASRGEYSPATQHLMIEVADAEGMINYSIWHRYWCTKRFGWSTGETRWPRPIGPPCTVPECMRLCSECAQCEDLALAYDPKV